MVMGKSLSWIIVNVLEILAPFMSTTGPNSSWKSLSLLKLAVRFFLEFYETFIGGKCAMWLSFACNYASFLSIVVSQDEAVFFADVFQFCFGC